MSALIRPQELAAAIESRSQVVIADVRWTLNGPPGRSEFEAGHIPGAQWVDLERELSAPPGAGGRHPLPEVDVFQQAMRRIGVRNDVPVVVCDAATALAASRLWWLLTDAGHPAVQVLDGGVAAWVAAGYAIETGPAQSPAVRDFVAHPGQRARADAAAIAASLGSANAPTLIDVRAADRYAGENETIDPVAGHIPGAINRPSMANLDADGQFLGPSAIAERYLDVSEAPVLYCGSGITAAHTLLALEHAGINSARIYPGSWSDWIADPDRPVAQGATP
jgi:thiosulfate/3-mercaptopyruvate sulfurtransferase